MTSRTNLSALADTAAYNDDIARAERVRARWRLQPTYALLEAYWRAGRRPEAIALLDGMSASDRELLVHVHVAETPEAFVPHVARIAVWSGGPADGTERLVAMAYALADRGRGDEARRVATAVIGRLNPRDANACSYDVARLLSRLRLLGDRRALAVCRASGAQVRAIALGAAADGRWDAFDAVPSVDRDALFRALPAALAEADAATLQAAGPRMLKHLEALESTRRVALSGELAVELAEHGDAATVVTLISRFAPPGSAATLALKAAARAYLMGNRENGMQLLDWVARLPESPAPDLRVETATLYAKLDAPERAMAILQTITGAVDRMQVLLALVRFTGAGGRNAG